MNENQMKVAIVCLTGGLGLSTAALLNQKRENARLKKFNKLQRMYNLSLQELANVLWSDSLNEEKRQAVDKYNIDVTFINQIKDV